MTAKTLTGPFAGRPEISAYSGIDRLWLFALAGLLCVANLYATSVLHAFRTFGTFGSLARLLEINAIIWFAMFAIVKIGRSSKWSTVASSRDQLVAAAAVMLCVMPWHVLALPAMLLIAGWCVASAEAGSPTRRIGIILASIALSNLVGRCLLVAFGGPIVSFDAHFVALLAGVEARGNVVDFASGGRSFIVGLPCSSVHNMSLGFVLWATLTQLFSLKVTPRLIGWCVATALGLFLVNAIRLTLIAWYPRHFDTLHNGVAGEAFGWLSLLVAAAIAAMGVIDGVRRAR